MDAVLASTKNKVRKGRVAKSAVRIQSGSWRQCRLDLCQELAGRSQSVNLTRSPICLWRHEKSKPHRKLRSQLRMNFLLCALAGAPLPPTYVSGSLKRAPGFVGFDSASDVLASCNRRTPGSCTRRTPLSSNRSRFRSSVIHSSLPSHSGSPLSKQTWYVRAPSATCRVSPRLLLVALQRQAAQPR